MNEKITHIYLDMDGVLVAFSVGYLKLTGIDITGVFRSDDKFWKPIDKAGSTFWSELKWTVDGPELYDYLKNTDIELNILSAPSMNESSRIGKKEWVKLNTPETDLILEPAYRKRKYANSTSLLIDDREINIKQWVSSGGVGIIHTNTINTIKLLKELNI